MATKNFEFTVNVDEALGAVLGDEIPATTKRITKPAVQTICTTITWVNGWKDGVPGKLVGQLLNPKTRTVVGKIVLKVECDGLSIVPHKPAFLAQRRENYATKHPNAEMLWTGIIEPTDDGSTPFKVALDEDGNVVKVGYIYKQKAVDKAELAKRIAWDDVNADINADIVDSEYTSLNSINNMLNGGDN